MFAGASDPNPVVGPVESDDGGSVAQHSDLTDHTKHSLVRQPNQISTV